MADEKFKTALRLLAEDYYIVAVDGKLAITTKFQRKLNETLPSELYGVKALECEGEPNIQVVKESDIHPIVKSTKKMVISKPGDSIEFIDFIVACEVPQKVHLSGGGFFRANQYNKGADLEFQKILAKGYQLDILIGATKLYYKSGGAVQAIHNYILQGTWVSQYIAMEESLKAGTVEKHIKTNLSNETGKSSYEDR